MSRLSFLAVVLLALGILGCGAGGPRMPKLYAVKGKVTYKGKPVAKCTITLASENLGAGLEGGFSGKLNDAGEFELSAPGGKTGAAAGKYKVILNLPAEEAFKAMMDGSGKKGYENANPFPKEYGSLTTSKKEVEILPDNSKNLSLVIEL